MTPCLVCDSPCVFFRSVDESNFFLCTGCGLIQLDSGTIERIDAGELTFKYEKEYCGREMIAARERAFGVALARAAEVFFCSRRPIDRFLDIGSGPGLFLDAVSVYLPYISNRFYAIERFSPPGHTQHSNYRVGRVTDYPSDWFDGGMCIEVFEHLTPRMVDSLLREIAIVSRSEACFLINTGLATYTRDECPEYLDPLRRGHIMSWTVAAVDRLARPHGLIASTIPGRNWCFLLEKADTPRPSISDRLAQPLRENMAALNQPEMGASPIALLAEIALRETYYYDQFLSRTNWAMELNDEVTHMRQVAKTANDEVVALRTELAAIRKSRSWRLTAGARKLFRVARKVWHRS